MFVGSARELDAGFDPLESRQLDRVGFFHLRKDEVRLRGLHACVFASGVQM